MAIDVSGAALDPHGLWLGRVARYGIGPCVVTIRGGEVFEITSRAAPTVRDILEMVDPAEYVRSARGVRVGDLGDLGSRLPILAPCDLQIIKACGVTFARSMIERVIDERSGGDAALAEDLRSRIGAAIGQSLEGIAPGSPAAERAKKALISEGLWSQYLEVGIGPQAEIFTKAPVLSAIGHGGAVGVHPRSEWNNPEPELVLAINSKGDILGATMGNDVNLRDVEGRSALLLGHAKDNNAACAIGPMIRLFDAGFALEDLSDLTLKLEIEGRDGYRLEADALMRDISRTPADLAAQALDIHHPSPDGLMLFLGTPFAPTQDRNAPGKGFTHVTGDIVRISCPALGSLENEVLPTDQCPPFRMGIGAFMRNLAARELI
ncbi:MAG: fumarylacetoacetate hydrolase family protein [Paracoccaceae bacterium]